MSFFLGALLTFAFFYCSRSQTTLTPADYSDPCINYTSITNANLYDRYRSTDFYSMGKKISLCDSNLDPNVWSRFDLDIGTQLMDKRVKPWFCGTQAPIWLNETHPELFAVTEAEMTSTVCSTYNDFENCSWQGPVKIRGCNDSVQGGFFIYQLPVPPGCPLAYCVNALSHKQCQPPLVWIPHEFRCRHLGNVSWNDWESWSPCSKSCDYGTQTRVRSCEVLPCQGSSFEQQLCITSKCPEVEAEKSQGVIIEMQSKTENATLKVTQYSQEILDILRDNINDICSENASFCCGKALASNISTTNINFVTAGDIYVPSSYPRPNDYDGVFFKAIAVVKREVYKSICRSTRTAREIISHDSDAFKYITNAVLLIAANHAKVTIAVKTGCVVLTIENPVEKEVSAFESVNNVVQMIGSVVGTIAALGSIGGAILCYKKRRGGKLKIETEQRLASKESEC